MLNSTLTEDLSLGLHHPLFNAWEGGRAAVGDFFFVYIGTFVLHELCYFGFFIPYLIADFIPSLHRYKIQKDKTVSKEMYANCIKRLLFSHVVIQGPMIALTKLFLDFMGMSIAAPFPTWTKIATTCFYCIVIEDFYFYWVHRYLHHPSIYKHIHKIHHEHKAPFGIAAEYAHPIETAFLGIGTMLGPMLLIDHLLTLWIWLVVRLFQTIEVHSGYDFPWSLNRWIPFWGGAIFHDFHHEKFDGNYSSTFTLWDKVFGTDDKYLVKAHEREREDDRDSKNDQVEALVAAADSSAVRRSPRVFRRKPKALNDSE
eukprot:a676613_317.p1 GENE.a676613_317~~a676613_317.p1  ORF type:complete len:322 (-),score=116.69 a676613_317:21-959(-)